MKCPVCKNEMMRAEADFPNIKFNAPDVGEVWHCIVCNQLTIRTFGSGGGGGIDSQPKPTQEIRKIEWPEGKLAENGLVLLNLKIFIYSLLRDRITVGDLTDVLEEARTTNAAIFTNRTLYRYTCEIIERLLEER